MFRAVAMAALIGLCCLACATVEKAQTDARLVEAQKAFEEGERLLETERYAEAQPHIEHALKLREAVLGERHPDTAYCLHLLGRVQLSQGNYVRAEPLLKSALEVLEASLGKDHLNVASVLNTLALIYTEQAYYDRAEALYTRVLAIQETNLGKEHPHVAFVLSNLGIVYYFKSRYTQAESLYERALTILEARLGKDHLNTTVTLNNLALLYESQGQYTRAELLYQRIISIEEPAFGQSYPGVAQSLGNLANIYTLQSQYAKAEQLYARVIPLMETVLGETHPHFATALSNLGEIYGEQGQYEKAEQLLDRALSLLEATFGKGHLAVTVPLVNLATLHKKQGHYARAESLLMQALAIQESVLSENHPKVADSLHAIAQLRVAQQHIDKALPFFERALHLSEGHLRQEVFGFSEERLTSVLLLRRAEEEYLYSLVRSHSDNVRVRRLALSAALLRKGRSTEEIADTSHIIYRELEPADREKFAILRNLRTQIASLSLASHGRLSPTDYQRRLNELTDQGDALETDLAKRSEKLRALYALPSPSELLERVAATLPENGVLVEFVTYKDSSLIPKHGTTVPQNPSELRYLALLLFVDGSTRAVDLGPAAPIDQAAQRLHDALAGRAVSYQSAAQELYALTFRLLTPHLGKVQRLFLAPDGQLALVPFATLHDGRRFLVDAWDITYLTSGKDLLRRPEKNLSTRSVVVLAAPAFGTPPTTLPLAAQATLTERSASLERFFSTRRAELANQPWPPLPGTEREAKTIQRLFPQARLLLGSAATKEALLKLETPAILHLATHGFFLEDASAPAPSARAVVSPSLLDSGPAHLPTDPLLRSGLVLAGARASGTQTDVSRREDSLVTALELAGLNLWGTQLVVLSACDTGRGDVKLGQGVYGLRRALVVAGAETVVTSLWKVNDETTRELMEGYYRHLLAGQGRTTALREAMKELRKKKPHPYYWAPFIAIGQDEPLRGLGPHTEEQPAP